MQSQGRAVAVAVFTTSTVPPAFLIQVLMVRAVTTGVRPETGRQLIDHVACSRGLGVAAVTCWDGIVDDRRVSDHDGVMVELNNVD